MAQYKDMDGILQQLDEFYITAIVQQKHDDVPEDHKKHWKGIQSGINYARNTIIDAPIADVSPNNAWISVEDRLPEESGQYLATNGDIITVRMFKHPDGFTAFSKPSFCIWDNSGDGWWVKSTFPTHWMPLPAPPTEKEN